MIAPVLLGIALAAAPASPHLQRPTPVRPPSEDVTRKVAAASPNVDPEVRPAVEKMQKFYEDTRDFQANFQQTYKYKSFGRTTEARGRVRFLKADAAMRWDYLDKADKPEKVFVVNGDKVYAFDREAKQLTISGIDTERLSASITFLWGKGRLEREFIIKKADRPDLKDGIALELTPKTPDPRFQKVYFLVDPATYAVRSTLVIDPDGSENRMRFFDVKANTGFGPDAFHLDPPPDTQVLRLDQARP